MLHPAQRLSWLVAVLLAASLCAPPLRAEVSEIRISKQYGLPYLAVVVVEHEKLIEKHAKAAGLGDVKVNWVTIGSGGTSTDALLAGQLDFVTSGISNMMLLWSRTNGQVKAVSAAAAVPLILVTRNPNVKTIADFRDTDKIAVPTVKVSMQSTILGIAARQMFGEPGRGKFDPLTVTMAHPDATAFLLSGSGEVNSHFSAPPYQYQAMKSPAVHMVLNSTDVMGGPATITVVFGTAKFYDANPKTIAAIRSALDDAMVIIAKDRKSAADMYLDVTKEKMAPGDLADMIAMPGFEFTTTPHGTMKYAEQMYATGVIKTKPADWKDPFFASAHGLAGD